MTKETSAVVRKWSLLYLLLFFFRHWVMFSSLQPHEAQHARLPCPSPTPRAYSNSCALSRWCHPTISSSVVPFSSRPQSFCNARDEGSTPGSGRSPGGGSGNPLQYSCLENPVDRRARGPETAGRDWATKHAFSVLRHSESVLEIFFYILFSLVVDPRMFNTAACPLP